VAAHLLGAAMTDRRIRDLCRLLETEAEHFGASVTVEITNGGHVRNTFRIGTRQAFVITGFSPHSAWRTHRQVRAEARRALRNLTTR
jgi:hypothetical protein